jgi:hypothetical protein
VECILLVIFVEQVGDIIKSIESRCSTDSFGTIISIDFLRNIVFDRPP